jgi:erythromycin esterase
VKASCVEQTAGVWMRVDGPDTPKTGKSLGFDNMQNRPITGTSDWTRYDIVLDVPTDATAIAFGIRLSGKGQVWLDDVTLTTVSPDVPTTDMHT